MPKSKPTTTRGATVENPTHISSKKITTLKQDNSAAGGYFLPQSQASLASPFSFSLRHAARRSLSLCFSAFRTAQASKQY
eukprot:g26896.t1